ncbi:hypothetical protein BDZ45DRAFT_713793 [Acephala macrosclerotiorum]|nr:hypothetical protein BDZ45DRAFT_713793 [Acephala macrosclerotiorum]
MKICTRGSALSYCLPPLFVSITARFWCVFAKFLGTTLALAALASVAAAAIGSTPTASAPAGCATSYSGDFEITIINSTTPTTSKAKRQSSTCGQAGYLTVSLKDGILTDSQNRQGYIASNYQFQFNTPLQSNAIYTGGFSVCNNGFLALGGSNVFWECQTTGGPGIGTYSNLYSESTGAQCNPILINIIPCSGASSSGVSQVSDGQPQATGTAGTVTTQAVSQITDGQPQATGTAGQVTTAPISQISDGQIQGTTVAPKPTACVVSQISDGQVQVTVCPTTIAPAPSFVVSQISDGQVQVTICPTTAAPVSQISDGQIQATTTSAPVSQISDGQVQATSTGAPVSQISDGQVQATTIATSTSSSLAVVSQISDGQVQATGAANATSTPLQVVGNSGNGLAIASSFAAFMVGAAAVLLL